jgi:YgiT-type zinc finger domain-containing protein
VLHDLVMQADPQHALVCTQCGAHDVRQHRARSAFWQEERLVVVQDIPALVCETCGEQFYDDTTAIALDLLRGEGFPRARARAVIEVDVFSFDDGVTGPALS